MLEAVKQMMVAGFLPSGIIHVGANEGQERHDYAAAGASPCLYVEPVEAAFAILKDNLTGMSFHKAIQAVCAEREGEEVLFNVASNGGQSSSLLPLGAHAEHHPTIHYTGTQTMVTTTVDRVIQDHNFGRVPNLLVIDAQGADLRVLGGATKSLPAIDGVFIEVSQEPLYEGGCTFAEIGTFLAGFDLHPRWMTMDRWGHGEAFFARMPRPVEVPATSGENLALRRPAAQSSLSMWSYHDVADGPAGAVNGTVTGRFGFHTDIEDEPWWQVDLEAIHEVKEVRVYNRADEFAVRARTLQVLLSEDGETWRPVHDQGGHTFGTDGHPLQVMLAGERARYVRLQLAERAYLHLDEVQVF